MSRGKPSRDLREQPLRIDGFEVLAILALERHRRDDADPHAQANIRLDDVGIARREHDAWLESLLAESALERRFARQAENVSHEWKAGEQLQLERLAEPRERMLLGHQHDAMPVVDRQQRQVREELPRPRRDREVDLVGADELGDLL